MKFKMKNDLVNFHLNTKREEDKPSFVIILYFLH